MRTPRGHRFYLLLPIWIGFQNKKKKKKREKKKGQNTLATPRPVHYDDDAAAAVRDLIGRLALTETGGGGGMCRLAINVRFFHWPENRSMPIWCEQLALSYTFLSLLLTCSGPLNLFRPCICQGDQHPWPCL